MTFSSQTGTFALWRCVSFKGGGDRQQKSSSFNEDFTLDMNQNVILNFNFKGILNIE